MESIFELRSLLFSVLSSGTCDGDEQELFDELVANEPHLMKIFNFGSRNPQEQKDIDSGKIIIDGRTLAVNSEFALQVSFISQQLNCSERFIAVILHSILEDNPTLSQVDVVEQVVEEYHEYRRTLAECIRFLFQAVDLTEKGSDSSTITRIANFARHHFKRSMGDSSLPYRIFAELTNLGSVIADARTAVTNAISRTNVPQCKGGNGNLGHGTLNSRYQSLLCERRTLAFAFYYASRTGFLSSSEIRLVIDWLEKNPKDDMTLYVLSAFFAGFDFSLSAPDTLGHELRFKVITDTRTVPFMKTKLAPGTVWRDPSLKAVVSLKWTLFLTEARLRRPTLDNVEGTRNEDLAMQVFNAVQGDAFSYLLHAISNLSPVRTTTNQVLLRRFTSSTNGADISDIANSLTDEFKPNFLFEIELLIRSLLTHAPAELRKIKHKQEDQFRPRADRHLRGSFRPGEPEDTSPPRNDIATLFQLIGNLYSISQEDRAVQFWGGAPRTDTPAFYEIAESETGRLPSFLRWAIEVREPELIISVFDMLSGLATGVACAECAYNFMATGSLDAIHGDGAGLDSKRFDIATVFTWRTIFGELESWASLGSNQRNPHGPATSQLQLAPTDVLLGLAFLKLTSYIAKFSVQARIAIASHPQYRAVSTLVSLIPLNIPLELKGAIFETLSTFCIPGAGIQGVDICKNIWVQMERLEIINVRGLGFAAKGVEIELEEVESAHKFYPATIPFLELLSNLLHTPKRVPLKSRVTEPEPINTIPENLGQPYRTAGIGPFVNFVVDNILAKLTRREFAQPSDLWKMAEISLCFIERCLASYDLESLPSLAEEYMMKGPEVLSPIVQHPGFDVLSRILSETPLRTMLLQYVVEGAEELARQVSEPRFQNVILRALRIVDRVLAIQDIFLDQLIPALSEFDSTSIVGYKVTQSFLSRIDQGLSLDHRSIPAIGYFVTYAAYPEIIYLAVKILSSLSQSPSFQNIAALIERSSESTLILDGFVRLLSSPASDDVGLAEEWVDLWTGAGAPDLDGEQNLFAQAIRVAILDLLLRGTKHNKSSSLAFLILFGKKSPGNQIQDPHALGSRENSLHVILNLLSTGVPRLNVKEERKRRRLIKSVPLFQSQPVLAEKLYKLLLQLCEHPRTSSSMMLYLRTREDFFARHLSVMAVHTPPDVRDSPIEVQYGDGSRVLTTCTTLKAFLQCRSWLLDLVSLELHVLTSKGQNQRVKDLLNILFGTSDTFQGDENDWEHDMFKPFNDVGQSRIRIIELFQSLEFEWFDSIAVSPIDLQFYKTLNLQACIRPDENGCELVDRTALLEMLSNARRMLLRQGQISSSAHNTQLELETKYILGSCVVENNRREVQAALNIGYESWKRLTDIVLTKCFIRIPHDQRETMLFDLLHVIPPVIRLPALPEASATILSEVLLLLITKLREERRQANLLSTSESLEASSLPVERMTTLLRHMLDILLDKNRRELVRGNVYAALVNYLHLVMHCPHDQLPIKNTGLSESTLSLLASSMSLSNSEFKKSSASASLDVTSFAIMKQVMDRLVQTVSKDAIDGTEVWKTVAFSLLESLARLSRLDTKFLVLNTLERYGLLSNFSYTIGDADSSLQDILRPEPDDLNPLYVYEAKIAFYIRLAQTRQGAERLLDSRILQILSQVDFLDARPEGPEANLGTDSFLPSVLSRYHQLLLPALQFVSTLVATLGPKHAVASKQAIEFLYSHKDTFVIMLKQETSLVNLSTIEELNILISLCSMVLPSVPLTDLAATSSGFGSLHNAVLGIASRTLGHEKWISSIRPADEAEALEDNTPSGDGSRESKFALRTRQVVQKLRKSIIGYLSSASTLNDPELVVVLSPSLSSRRDDHSGSSVPLPSVRDVISVTLDLSDELLGTMKEIDDVSTELLHRDHVRVNNIEELIGGVDSDAIRRLDAGQRRALVCKVLEQSNNLRRIQVESLLSMLEMLLHLTWRHIKYYSSDQASAQIGNFDRQRPFSRPQQSLSQSHLRASTLRFMSIPDSSSFRSEALSVTLKVVEKVSSIELNEELAGKSWRSNQSYLELMARCLRESVEVEPSEEK